MATFPQFYRPRPYQAELHQAMDTHRLVAGVYPRQSGKDMAGMMQELKEALLYPKTTGVYVSLSKPMIRDIAWQKTYLDPAAGVHVRALEDNVPGDLAKFKDTSMEIVYENKSRTKFDGYFQDGKDNNGVGSSFQRYTFTEMALFVRENPWPRLKPIVQNEHEKKRFAALSTPRGKRRNPLWLLMEEFKDHPDGIVLVRTIDDLNEMMRREGLPPVMSEANLEQERADYLKLFGNTRMFEQEYYCSFEEMDAAAVYGEAYMKMVAEKRITTFNLLPAPVYVMFDIGSAGKQSDATSWIAFQWVNGRLWLYDCGEGHGKPLPEYVDELQQKHWFNQLDRIILPWDAEHHNAAISQTAADLMRLRFPRISVLAKSGSVNRVPGQGRWGDEITDIQATRLQLYNTLIHGDPEDTSVGNCQLLLESIENYKYARNEKLNTWSDKPVHDQYSHLCDALRYVVQATKELDFFGNSDFGSSTRSDSYQDDWTGVWS